MTYLFPAQPDRDVGEPETPVVLYTDPLGLSPAVVTDMVGNPVDLVTDGDGLLPDFVGPGDAAVLYRRIYGPISVVVPVQSRQEWL